MKNGKTTVIEGGLLIDGTGKPPVKDAVILLEDSKIRKVDRIGGAKIPEGAEIIDASGKTVMPGLIDAHVHLASVVGFDPDAATAILRTPPSLLALHAAKHAREMLEAGFTAVRDLSGLMVNSEIISLRNAINMGLVPGPRIMAAGWVEMTGGHGDIMNRWEPTWPRRPGDPNCADGPWVIRKRIREFARERADLIKTSSSGHPPYTNISYTLEELKVLVDEAHTLGMKVACHSESLEGNKHALRAGVDTIEHGYPLDDEAIGMFVKTGTILVPTLTLTREGADVVVGRIWPPPERLGEVHSFFMENFRKAHKAGVRIAMGTDTYRIMRNFWGENAFELELMVKGGMSETESIVASTKTGSEALGLEDKIGTIQEGKLADIIIVDGNPLNDIKILQDKKRIHTVIKNGVVQVDRVNKGGELLV